MKTLTTVAIVLVAAGFMFSVWELAKPPREHGAYTLAATTNAIGVLEKYESGEPGLTREQSLAIARARMFEALDKFRAESEARVAPSLLSLVGPGIMLLGSALLLYATRK